MKKLLCIVCLLATVLFVDTASACNGRCGGYYGRASYGRSYFGRGYARSYGYRGHYGRGYAFRGGRGYYGRGYSNRGFVRHYAMGGGRSFRGGYSRW